MEVNYNIHKSEMLLKGEKARITSRNDRGLFIMFKSARRKKKLISVYGISHNTWNDFKWKEEFFVCLFCFVLFWF